MLWTGHGLYYMGISLWKYMGDDSIVLSDNKSCGDVFSLSKDWLLYRCRDNLLNNRLWAQLGYIAIYLYYKMQKIQKYHILIACKFVSDSIGFCGTYEDNLGELNDVGVLWRTIDAGWTWDTIFSSILYPKRNMALLVFTFY